MVRDLKADFEEWHSDLINGTRSTDWFYLVDNYIERAIAAEEELAKIRLCIGDIENECDITEYLKNQFNSARSDNATLREENDLQRQSIQDLSAQVVAYQKMLADIKKYFDNPDKYGGAWPEYYSAIIEQVLASPDPGAKVKTVVEKAQALCQAWEDEVDNETEADIAGELIQAFADLEGGTNRAVNL